MHRSARAGAYVRNPVEPAGSADHLVHLGDQGVGALDAKHAIAAGEVAPYVVDTYDRGGYEQQGAGVSQQALAIHEV